MFPGFLLFLFIPLALLFASPDRVLFDFESGTYAGWKYEGSHEKPTFGAAPFHASQEVPKWRTDRDFAGWQGKYMVIVGDTRHGRVEPGTLTSDEFEITHPYLKFNFGAEAHPAVYVALLVDREKVRVAYGNNSYDMRVRGWDVRPYRGRKARLVIEDKSDTQSLLRVDHFVLSDTPPPAVGIFDASEQESDTLRYGELRHVVSPPPGTYFAYTSLVRGPDGKWHFYATQCANGDTYKPENHRTIVHATAPGLAGPWTLDGPVLSADANQGEAFLWDPYVMVHDGRYYMFYVGSGRPWAGWDKNNNWRQKDFGPASTQGPFGIHLAVSSDGVNWKRHAAKPLFTDNPFAFTPFVLRVKEEWVMYYAGAEPAGIMGKHAILARTSQDLIHWGGRRVVMQDVTDTTPWPEHSFFHDPFVFRRGSEYFLLAGPINNNNQSRYHYRRLYRSRDPLQFDATIDEKGLFAEGGPKLVEENGFSYITHSGRYAGGVWLAPVQFRQGASVTSGR